MNADDILPYDRWNGAVKEMAKRFTDAQPFPHIVLDDFLQPQTAAACLEEFPALDSEQWIHYTHVNERKYGKSDPKSFSPVIGATIDEVNSARFVRFLEEEAVPEQGPIAWPSQSIPHLPGVTRRNRAERRAHRHGGAGLSSDPTLLARGS